MSEFTVPWREAPIGPDGRWSPPWVRFLNELSKRIGGTGDTLDLASVVTWLTSAQALIDFQSVTPRDVRIDEALRKIEEVAGMIPPAPNLRPILQKLEELEGWQAALLLPDVSKFISLSALAGYAQLSGATFSGVVTAPKFQTIEGSASAATGVATTVIALPNQAPSVYLVSANIGTTNDTANYCAYGVVLADGTSARLANVTNGALHTITLSGLAVQSTQSSGTTKTINATATRIG